MTGISTLSPASTYPDLFQIANSGQGLNSTPSQVQDGLGNPTSMTISSDFINFQRSVSEFQIDGIPLTADINTLNSVSDVANANYILFTENPQLTNGLVLTAGNGLSLNASQGNYNIMPVGALEGIVELTDTQPPGYVVSIGGGNFNSNTILSDATIDTVNGNGVNGNTYLSVIDDTNVQRVNVQLNGFFESQKSQLNFIPGVGMGINVIDDPVENRTNIILSTVLNNGLMFKGAVYAATTGALPASTYNNGASGVGATLTENANGALAVDGVNPPVSSLVIINNQASAVQNGVYSVTQAGSAGAPFILTRATFYDAVGEIEPGDLFVTTNGLTQAGTGWVEVNTVNTIGTDPISFSKVPLVTTGTVTSVSGTLNQINVANGTTTPVVSISPSYVGQTSITTLGTVTTGTWESDPIEVDFGGTGLNQTIPYSVICGGIGTTTALQSVADVGNMGEVLTSAGPGALPTWQPGGGGSSFTHTDNQPGHGLSVGDVIRVNSSGDYVTAQASSSAAATSVVGIVINVIDADNFTYQWGGMVTVLSGLTQGSPYFLDPDTSGQYTETIPTDPGQVVLPLFYALTATRALWQPKTAIELM
jgi:hypothetical protein